MEEAVRDSNGKEGFTFAPLGNKLQQQKMYLH